MDLVDVGLVHALQKLPRVRGERFDVAALSLGVDRVECERRLARPAHAGDHGHLVDGHGKGDVLEIINAGSLNLNGFFRHTDENLRKAKTSNNSARTFAAPNSVGLAKAQDSKAVAKKNEISLHLRHCVNTIRTPIAPY